MLLGEFNHSIDEKGRLIIPAKLREDLGDSFVICNGLEGCLFVYSQEEWNKFVQELETLPRMNKDARIFKRYFFGSASEGSFDKQGRVLVPPSLRKAAHLEKDVVLVGVQDRVEIWDKEKQQWISKQDVGTVSYSEKEKGQASDSFKRACFNWGIGRELYTAPFIWISAENVSIKPKGDRYTTSEHFLVRAIDYNEEREISYLMIVNGKGKKVFEMGKPRKADGKKPVPASNEDIGANIITEIQRAALEKELKRTGVLMEVVLGRYNIQSLEEMTEDVYTKALAGLKRTKTRAA